MGTQAKTPVLIGASQFTWRGGAETAPAPLGLVTRVARGAAGDAGLSESDLRGLDGIGVVGFTLDAPGALAELPVPRLVNPPASLAKALGAAPRWSAYTHMGGNSPQHLINLVCERIARGEMDFALVVGAEFLGSVMRRLARGVPFVGYDDAETTPPERVGDPRPGVTPHEEAHGLGLPVNMYPMFENALRARDGRSLEAHQQRMGRLFAPFTRVAAANPHAWFQVERSPEELIAVGPENRMIGYPYPKYLNAIMQVDQSAAVLIASAQKAGELGVAEDRLVYLHGCADAADLWFPLERQNYHSSPAMRLTGQRALEMAGIGVSDLTHIDLYSCFPSAVEVGAESLGLALDDPRGLTVTGGLPYFGGPGNNYALHAIATLVHRLRGRPDDWGLSTANGWFLTKQSTGVYSARPPRGPFEREDPAIIQRSIDALDHPPITEAPEGPATVETYTVVHARQGYRMGIVIGRDAEGRRFVANTPRDEATLRGMEAAEQIGRRGVVSRMQAGGPGDHRRNLFVPE
ncbi:MAG: acetyl-CoA acetyltransferase [Caulobacteraceae bacterium]|nr:acetyl-CoA acetyltransferase [Caulobacteraceae bacterium]